MLQYWFLPPNQITTGIYYYIGITVLFFVVSVITFMYVKSKKKADHILYKYIKSIPSGVFWFGVVWGVFSFLRYEGVYILSSRIWMAGIIASFIWWIYYPMRALQKKYPKDKLRLQHTRQNTKYHPKKMKH